MSAQQDVVHQTAVEGVATLPWGSATGDEDKRFEFSFTPRPKTKVIRRLFSKCEQSTTERLFEATAGAKIWAASVAMKLDRSTRDRLFRQLDNLHDEDEWFEGDIPVALESFKSFVRAIISETIGGRPGLSLTPQGNLIAIWSDEQAKLAIEFKSGNSAKFIWRQMIEGNSERAAGITTISRLPTFLAPLKGKDWFIGS